MLKTPADVRSDLWMPSSQDRTDDPILGKQHQRATAHDMGAGHVNPTKAIDPGLVYDLGITEYAGYI